MQDKIINLLNKESLSVLEMKTLLKLNSRDKKIDISNLKELNKVLYDMEEKCLIYRAKKSGKYLLFKNSHLRVGRLIGNKKGFGFVDIEGDVDVFVARINMNGAIHGDTVIVELLSPNSPTLEGKIIKIVKRDLAPLVGEFYYKKGMGNITLDDEKVKLKIIIDKKKTMGAMNGHKVLVKLLGKKSDGTYAGEVVKILGHVNDPGVDILSVATKYNLNETFSDEVMKEVNNLPISVSKEEMVGRTDLRSKTIFTIDGKDTKDIDDAVSIEVLKNGNYQLGVHIADVSYYVKAGSMIDNEAYERGTSVYLVDRVIPMLPHKLSNGICSLNPSVDRLAISCDMEIDSDGNVVNYSIYESVINSKKQMNYEAVNLMLEKNQVLDDYKIFEDDLRLMAKLANILRKNKEKRGYIDFDIDEAKVIADEKGKPIDVKLRYRGVGEKIIEDFMIAANETVASHIYFMELPFIYRVHGKPSEEKIENFKRFIKALGYTVEIRTNDITPLAMQRLLNSFKDKKEFHILSQILLRSMQKAVYDKTNIGHFGLGSKIYTHFTSPIRRYPDTTVHRLLRTYLFENKIDNQTISYWDNKLISLAEHSSLKERDAVACEREVDDMKKAEYMEDHIGEVYTGMISSVMSFGFFVELPNLIEGLVSIDALDDDNYIYDENMFSLSGVSNKKQYRLGDTVKVVVTRASKEARQIDFNLYSEEKEEN
ncbi:MAG: ribonuclease R [Bacilli bacterium]|nr:ribonuclease R [Bacilli bacterium]